eukprot:Gb_27278 [translate_table: standard]
MPYKHRGLHNSRETTDSCGIHRLLVTWKRHPAQPHLLWHPLHVTVVRLIGRTFHSGEALLLRTELTPSYLSTCQDIDPSRSSKLGGNLHQSHGVFCDWQAFGVHPEVFPLLRKGRVNSNAIDRPSPTHNTIKCWNYTFTNQSLEETTLRDP